MWRKAQYGVERSLGKRTKKEYLYGKGGCTTYSCEVLGIKVSPTDKGRDEESIENKLKARGIKFDYYSMVEPPNDYSLIEDAPEFRNNGFLNFDGHTIAYKTIDGRKYYYDINYQDDEFYKTNPSAVPLGLMYRKYGRPLSVINIVNDR